MGIRFSRWPRRILLALAAVLGAVGAAELGLRVYSDCRYPKILRLDRALGWRHAPNVECDLISPDGGTARVVINGYGNRGPAHPRTRTPGRRRVLVLGDSFAEGGQVDEHELSTALMERTEPALEVINAGVGAWGTVQEYLYLRDDGLAFDPDVVLVLFYDNDLVDNCLSYYPGIGPRPYAELRGDGVHIVEDYGDEAYLAFCMAFPLRRWLYRDCYLYRSLNKNVWQPRHAEALQRTAELDHARFSAETRLAVLAGVLSRMQQLCAGAPARLAVALIPTRDDVQGGPAAALAAVATLCADKGIDTCSLLEPMQRACTDGRQPYFDHDIHWTREGHAVAAAALVPFVAARR